MRMQIHRASKIKNGWRIRFATRTAEQREIITSVAVEEEELAAALKLGAFTAIQTFEAIERFVEERNLLSSAPEEGSKKTTPAS